MYRRITLAILIFILIAASFCASCQFSTKAPVMDCPPVLELGDQENGTKVKAVFAIRNCGREPLVVNGFSTSCGCLSVEIEGRDGPQPVDQVIIQPGEQAA